MMRKLLFIFVVTSVVLGFHACKYNQVYTKELQRVVHTDSLIWHVKVLDKTIDVKNDENNQVYYIVGKNISIANASLNEVNVLDGSVELFSFDHKLLGQGNFKKGVKDGEWKSFDQNGKLIFIKEYKNGDLEEIKDYSGSTPLIGQFKNGQKDGTWIENGDTIEYKKGLEIIPEIDTVSNADTLTK